MGLHVLGHEDSPVLPVMVYHATAMQTVSRLCLARGVALVMVAFPACPLLLARARVCISAAHTR
jgi:serine palmitoyltransferase